MTDDPILICYDGSEGADRAIVAAAALLGPRHAIVLDVGPMVTQAESLAVLSPVAPTAAFADLNADDALRVAEAGAERARAAGFAADARAELDAPTWAGIEAVADEIAAAVIVLGSRGLNDARELFEGSRSHEVAEHAKRPVLIVPPPQGRPGAAVDAPILICYDGSEGARRAIPAAAALLGDRAAVVLDVGPLEVVAESYVEAGEVAQLLAEGALEQAKEGAELARASGFRAEARADVDAPTWQAVVTAADELGAAAIVLGSRGLTGIREFADGVSHEVALHAGRPVLIVPPAD